MSGQSYDPDKFKAAQKKSWDSVANGWKKWWPSIEQGAQVISDHMVDSAGIKPGDRVLDIATGIGEPAVTAARRVGESGSVMATDQSGQMLEVARERVADLGLKNISFHVSDCETLDVSESAFNAVICRWGIMFLPNPQASLKRAHDLLVPGGKIAAAVWDTPDKAPGISLSMMVIRKMLNAPPPHPDTPGPFAMADRGKLITVFESAGFNDVRIEPKTVKFSWTSAEDHTQWIKDVASPIKAMLDGEPPERRAEVWDAVTEAARAYAADDGSIAIDNQTICISAAKADA
ncbi:MAG: class I SAM-dependent methyltransferase [Nitrospinota bacterium]